MPPDSPLAGLAHAIQFVASADYAAVAALTAERGALADALDRDVERWAELAEWA